MIYVGFGACGVWSEAFVGGGIWGGYDKTLNISCSEKLMPGLPHSLPWGQWVSPVQEILHRATQLCPFPEGIYNSSAWHDWGRRLADVTLLQLTLWKRTLKRACKEPKTGVDASKDDFKEAAERAPFPIAEILSHWVKLTVISHHGHLFKTSR